MPNHERPTGFSRRRLLIGAAQATIMAILAACAPPRPISNTPESSPTAPMALPTTVPPQPSRQPSATNPASTPPLEISLADKIAQMVLVGFRGLTIADGTPTASDLAERRIGGVVLFDVDLPLDSPVRNIQSPQQLRALTAQLQERAARPLLISVDQEGGRVARLNPAHGFPATMSEQSLGKLNDLVKTRENAETIARMLASAGINLNLAPVVDLNVNPQNPVIGQLERSFSADPTIVTSHALEEIRAHHKYGVLTTLKHFPGHGSSRADSHRGFVDVTNTWSQVELEPYRRIIAAGEADAIMTAHIFNARLDPDVPATLSRRIITGILREELAYDGVVISDDMQMGAISQYYGLETAVEKAINAGVDILAVANNQPFQYDPAAAERVIAIIEKLVAGGRITRDRIDQSYGRIMRMKGRLT
ncbi:MAG: glycoside hydrolase family 3 protein [Rudaea sp.]